MFKPVRQAGSGLAGSGVRPLGGKTVGKIGSDQFPNMPQIDRSVNTP
jgi:hypothetical protein